MIKALWAFLGSPQRFSKCVAVHSMAHSWQTDEDKFFLPSIQEDDAQDQVESTVALVKIYLVPMNIYFLCQFSYVLN